MWQQHVFWFDFPFRFWFCILVFQFSECESVTGNCFCFRGFRWFVSILWWLECENTYCCCAVVFWFYHCAIFQAQIFPADVRFLVAFNHERCLLCQWDLDPGVSLFHVFVHCCLFPVLHCVILYFESPCRRFWKAGKMTVWGLGTCRKSRPLYFSECCSLFFSFSHFPFPHARTSAKPWRSRGWRSMMTRKNLRHQGTLKWYLLKRRRSEQPRYFEHGGMSWNLYTQYKGSYVHDAAAGVFGMKFHYFMIFKNCWPRLGIDSYNSVKKKMGCFMRAFSILISRFPFSFSHEMHFHGQG